MDIQKLIANVNDLPDDAVIYAKRVEGRFHHSSEAVSIELTEEEIDEMTEDISAKYCPGYDYFLEVALIKELLEDIADDPEFNSVEEKARRVIHYAEFDA